MEDKQIKIDGQYAFANFGYPEMGWKRHADGYIDQHEIMGIFPARGGGWRIHGKCLKGDWTEDQSLPVAPNLEAAWFFVEYLIQKEKNSKPKRLESAIRVMKQELQDARKSISLSMNTNYDKMQYICGVDARNIQLSIDRALKEIEDILKD